ncbi:MAG: ABC transporter ATP-binding protein [Pseudomonadota bacterium]
MSTKSSTVSAVEPATALEATGLEYEWTRGAPVLTIDRLSIKAGERVFLEGPSGSGKSTLLSLIAGITVPQSGSLHVLETDLAALSSAQRDAFRAAQLGIIFQLFNLVPYLSLVDNVLLPCRFSPSRAARAISDHGSTKNAARHLLNQLGLEELLKEGRRTGTLSVGQQQRVAAARALIGAPAFIIADEPTSALDEEAREDFVTTLLKETAQNGAALLFVSHEKSLAPLFDTRLSLPAINKREAL